MSQQVYNDAAASGYNRAFAQVSSHFAAALVGAVGLSAGDNVLDIATGTGMAAAIALTAVGITGSVTAADISPAMVKEAQGRLEERSYWRRFWFIRTWSYSGPIPSQPDRPT